MDAIADAIGYAKGTIYQHFASKEDMLLAVVARRKLRYASWFRRAAQFEGRSRERLTGIGLADRLFRRLHPDHLDDEHLLRQRSIWDKTSDNWRQKLSQAGKECEDAILSIIMSAQADGDLSATPADINDMVLGLRAMSQGTHMLIDHPGADACQHLEQHREQHLEDDPLDRLSGLQHRLIDAYGWLPLYADWDYRATEQRLLTTIFAEEAKAAGLAIA